MKSIRLIFALGAGFLACEASAISLSTINQFASGTEGWTEGNRSPNAPSQSNNLGWDGSAGYLSNTSAEATGSGAGSGAGSRQQMWNTGSDWTGDYIAAGVTGIRLQADNGSGQGSSLSLRIALFGDGGWFVSDAQSIVDSSLSNDWTSLSYNLDVGTFTRVSGSGSFIDTLSSVTRFEILVAANLPTLSRKNWLQGDQGATALRFDDISAIPEPGAGALAGCGAILLATIASRLRRRRSVD